MSNEKLKPCPFCGGEARLEEGFGLSGKYAYVNCVDDGCQMFVETFSKKKDEAIKIWNTRKGCEE